jgi:hypothetical protein
MAHERMFDYPGNSDTVHIRFNALQIVGVHLNGTAIAVDMTGPGWSFDYGSAEAAEAAYELWTERAENAR